MISYKDKTFCSAPCAETSCSRQFTNADREDAAEWWKGFSLDGGPPIAFSDFSGNCSDYNAIEEYHQDENGEYHREDGPAMILSDGSLHWLIHGRRHRTDGPAIDGPSLVMWYIRGFSYTFDQWCRNVGASEKEKALLLLKYKI